MEKLTNKQSEILTAIKKFVAEKGYAPTIRELCKIWLILRITFASAPVP